MASGSAYFGFTAAGSSGGGGTIGGSIAATQVAFGTAPGNTIAGDSTFIFDGSGTDKEVAANVVKINQNTNPGALPIGKDGYLEYVGGQLFFTIGSTSYKISLTL